MVAAIENGTVLDHIPNERLFDVVSMLHLDQMSNAITIGFNFKSAVMGCKSIIKIADKYFTNEELNQLSAVAPNITLCVIKDYEIIEKRTVVMPDELVGTHYYQYGNNKLEQAAKQYWAAIKGE